MIKPTYSHDEICLSLLSTESTYNFKTDDATVVLVSQAYNICGNTGQMIKNSWDPAIAQLSLTVWLNRTKDAFKWAQFII